MSSKASAVVARQKARWTQAENAKNKKSTSPPLTPVDRELSFRNYLDPLLHA
jgi:hypothetical protein